jgi:hypothetical protein
MGSQKAMLDELHRAGYNPCMILNGSERWVAIAREGDLYFLVEGLFPSTDVLATSKAHGTYQDALTAFFEWWNADFPSLQKKVS